MVNHDAGRWPEFDERREIWKLLKRASEKLRIEWLKWCCQRISHPAATTTITHTTGTVSEVWHDWASLVFGSTLSVEESGRKLVDMLRRSGG